MNKEQVNKFEWNDKLAAEYGQFYHSCFDNPQKWLGKDCMEAFKSSKQQQEEWEVVSHRHKESKVIERYVHALLYNPTYEIYQIRRPSDSATLEIGKEYEIETRKGIKNTVTVECFFSDKRGMWVRFKNGYGSLLLSDITSIVECKPEIMWVVFTTDGFGYPTWIVSEWTGTRNETNFDETVKDFATEQEAWKFVKEHKPYLSIAMIREALKEMYVLDSFVDRTMDTLQQGLYKLKIKSNE